MDQWTPSTTEELALYGTGGGGGAGAGIVGGDDDNYDQYLREYMKAMAETERRAAEDRARAIATVQEAMAKSTTGEEYARWSAMVQQLTEAPETITPEIAGKMYEAGRTPVEAQTQQMLRNIQESYYGRGTPGGAMRGATEQVQIGKMGTLSDLARNIALERAQRRRGDIVTAGTEAGKLAEYTGGVRMGGAKNLADIYSQTITATPKIW